MRVEFPSARGIVLRSPSGDLTAGEDGPVVKCKDFVSAIIDLRVTALVMADADDEVDFYIQTHLNGQWIDVANVHFDNGDEPITSANRLIGIGPKAAGVAVITPTDGGIADNTSQDVPLGAAVRIKTIVTGATAPSYAYEARIGFTG